jgi:hypothetical protein
MRIRTTVSNASFVVILCCVALAAPGCASKLQLSPACTELRSHLSDSQARVIVESAFKRDELGKGGAMEAHWNLNVGPTYPVDIKVVDRAVEYLSPGREHAKGEELDKGCTTVRGKLESRADHDGVPTVCRRRVALDNLWRIRVSEEHDSSRTVAGYSVNIQESVSTSVLVNIPGKQLDPLLAALTFYSPRAQVLQGGGF